MSTNNPKKNLNTRAIAVKILQQVLVHGRRFESALITQHAEQLSAADRAFVSQLCFGTLRYYPQLWAIEQKVLASPLRNKDQDLALLIIIGIYQLYYLETPAYAAIHATVEAVKTLKKVWAKKLINGVLRTALRDKAKLLALPDPAIQTALPDWLSQAFQKAWPTQTEAIANASLTHPPFSLRINTQSTAHNTARTALDMPDTTLTPIPYCPAGVILSPPREVQALPGFTKGALSVQDGAAQLAAPLLMPEPNQRLLDACAAPGGKTAHLLEIAPASCSVWALDKDPERLKRVEENLKRLKLEAQLFCADATDTATWWDNQPFDRILLDVPCSATGILRRHPDIKIHRQPSDIPKLIEEQRQLLTKMWPLLKPGGILLYVTCSILPAENVDQMEWFVAQHPDAEEVIIDAPWGSKQAIGRQILPGQHPMDGFYYARVRKTG